MNARTTLSAKGQVVIPKDVRERLAWVPGTALDVVETSEGLVLRRSSKKTDMTFEEAEARLRAAVRYEGPYVSESDWNVGIDKMMRNRTEL